MTQHPNSRKITIFRNHNFVQNAQNPDDKANEAVADFLSQASKSIGPYYESNAAKIIGSGLTLEEQKLIMPHVLNMSAEDKDFKKAVFDFFNSLVTKIPYSTGLDLEIGLTESNDKAISAENLPISVVDFVKYRHASNHPWVASSRTSAQGNQLKHFYIHDVDAQVKEDDDKLVLQDQADAIYLQIKDQSQKVTMLLTLLGKDERDYLTRNGDVLKRKALKDIVENDAPKFLKVYNEDRFELRYWLKAMVKADIVELVGNDSYVVKETKKLLGRTLLDALLFLEDPKNADAVSYLKANTQDVLRKPKTVRRQGVR